MTTNKRLAAFGGALGIVVLLATAGCSSTGAGTGTGDQAAASTTKTSRSATADAGATPTASATSGSGSGTTTGSTSGSGSAGTTGSLRSGQCATPDLAGSVVAAPGGGSAGHTELEILLKNESAKSCTLQGWPGVSFVGSGNGTQIGASATLDRQSPHGTVTLASGSTAHAVLQVAQAENYGTSCGAENADGFRVYPPGEKRSLFVQNDQLQLKACTNPKLALLDVQAFQPGS